MGSDDEYSSSNSDSDVEETLDDGEGGKFEFSDDDFDIPDDVEDTLDFDDDRQEKIHNVLTEKDILKRQEEDITHTSVGLCITRASATILLQHYNWYVNDAMDAWIVNEEKVRKDVGLLENLLVAIQSAENIIQCSICSDDFRRDGTSATTTCGHLFCDSCWTQYLSVKINEGPGCLKMRCPEPSCGVAVDKDKYYSYLLGSYVENQRTIKWCPGPGCEYAVDILPDGSTYDVVCNSGHSFCWNCLDDAHRPVDCDTVGNVTWILANSKHCPKCKRPIQKYEGCMHMTCFCGFEFCWLCLGKLSTHEEDNYDSCNVYEKAKAEGAYDEEEEIKKQAKDYLDRYAFFCERFVENQKSRLKEIESLKKMLSEDLPKLGYRYNKPDTQFKFIIDAWRQIIECRRVLKWTCVYGYYIPESDCAEKNLFGYLQGEAESRLEELHQCAEQELKSYLMENNATKDFNPENDALTPFRIKLLQLTKATGT
ncbi:hypothetical protein MKX03_024555 [Papaver bracteatum]|nr:hypothetical protein MKX03_024555 [Papaver bracteatum]